MKRLISLAAIFFIAACSTGTYTPRIEVRSEKDLTIHLDHLSAVSSEEMMRLLLTEAAHQTIDRGAIYLRIDTVSIGDSSVQFEKDTNQTRDVARAPSTAEGTSDIDQLLGVVERFTIESERSGSIAITIGRERPPGERVFEASKLLDELHRGALPVKSERQ